MLSPKLIIRRRIAVVSFIVICLTLIALFAIIIIGDEGTAQRLDEAEMLISTIVLCLTGIVSGYFIVAQRHDEKVDKNDHTD